MALRTVVGEELAMAGLPTARRHVLAWLEERGAGPHVHTRWEHVPSGVRLPLLLELAAARPGVRGLVVCTPDRHGGVPEQWWAAVVDLAATGVAVVVTCLDVSARALGVVPTRLGAGVGPR